MPLVNDTYSNYGASSVAGGSGGVGTALLSTDTTCHLQTGDGSKFPSLSAGQTFRVQIGTSEISIVTARTGDVLTLTRGAEGTTAITAPLGTSVLLVLTAAQLADLTTGTFTGPLTITSGGLDITGGTLVVSGGGITSLDGGTITTDGSSNLTIGGNVSTGQSSVATPGNNATITTSGVGVARVNPSGAVTGIILQSGTRGGQRVTVVNESGHTLTMAASGTSNVADGTSDIIQSNAAREYVWDSGTSLWSSTVGGIAAGGASTADHFVVGQNGQNDTDITNRIVIPGLSASPDIRPGGANDWEFDSSSTTGWSSFGTHFSSFDFNTTALSHAYVKGTTNSGSDAFIGIIHAVAASIPYTVTAKLSDHVGAGTGGWPALFVSDNSGAAGNSIAIGVWQIGQSAGTAGIGGATRGGTFTNLLTLGGFADSGKSSALDVPCYFRIVVHAANNVDIAFSQNGLIWYTLHSGYSLLSTAGYFGVADDPFNDTHQSVWDWIRFS
jgi:hypothetical protein